MTYFLTHREVFDHPLFENDKFSRRDAWLWLIAFAAWTDKRISCNGKVISLKRGQLSYSTRFLAAKWRWPKSVVERFLVRLKTETMIGTDSGTGQLIITICNYDFYQKTLLISGTDSGTDSGTGAGQERDRCGTNTINSNKNIKDSNISPLPPLGQLSIPDQIPKSPPQQKPKTELYEALEEFIAHRKAMKKPMTPYAVKKLKIKLNKLIDAGYDVKELHDNAIEHGWQTVYLPKDDTL